MKAALLSLTLIVNLQSANACSLDNTCGPGISPEECHQQVISLRQRATKKAAAEKSATAASAASTKSSAAPVPAPAASQPAAEGPAVGLSANFFK